MESRSLLVKWEDYNCTRNLNGNGDIYYVHIWTDKRIHLNLRLRLYINPVSVVS